MKLWRSWKARINGSGHIWWLWLITTTRASARSKFSCICILEAYYTKIVKSANNLMICPVFHLCHSLFYTYAFTTLKQRCGKLDDAIESLEMALHYSSEDSQQLTVTHSNLSVVLSEKGRCVVQGQQLWSRYMRMILHKTEVVYGLDCTKLDF